MLRRRSRRTSTFLPLLSTLALLACGPEPEPDDASEPLGRSGSRLTVANVTASPPPGSINAGSTLVLSTATSGATIHYTTDGTDPRTSSTRKRYSSPIVAGTFTVRAYASQSGMTDSAVSSLAYTLNTSSYVDIRAHRAVANDGVDDTPAIRAAITAAKLAGKAVFIPAGIFQHAEALEFDGVDLVGTGTGSVLHATHPDEQNILFKGSGVTVSALKLTSDATDRRQGNRHQRLVLSGATDFIVERVTVDGSSAAGIFNYGGTRGVIRDNTVKNTQADGIHNTRAASFITIEYNTVSGTGDDLIAVVSYVAHGPTQASDITIRRNTVSGNTHGRGIAILGSTNILIEDNTITAPNAAGVYIASESQYNTHGVSHITIRRNTLETAGNSAIGHGALMVYSSTSLPVTDIRFIGNRVYNSRKMAVHLRGASIGTVEFEGNLLRTCSNGALIASNFTGQARFIGNTVEETRTQAIVHEAPNGSSLTLDGNTLRNINSSLAAGVDVIRLLSGTMQTLVITNNVHTQPAGYPLRYFIFEEVTASTQVISGNSSPLCSRLNGHTLCPTP
jgi:parallel beta-helix repeat protein